MRRAAIVLVVVLLAGCAGSASEADTKPSILSVQYEGQMGPGGNPSSRGTSGIVWCEDGVAPIVTAHYELTSGALSLRLVTLNEEPERQWRWNVTGPAVGDLVQVLPVGTSNYGFSVHWGTDGGEIVRDGRTFAYPPASKGFDGSFVALAHCPDPDGVSGMGAA